MHGEPSRSWQAAKYVRECVCTWLWRYGNCASPSEVCGGHWIHAYSDFFGLPVQPCKRSAPALVALDGKALAVRGFAQLHLDRSDGCVHLPVIDVEAVVIDSLDAVDASVLIGGDVISGAGGVHLEYQDTVLSAIWFGPEKRRRSAPGVSRYRAVCDLVWTREARLCFCRSIPRRPSISPREGLSRVKRWCSADCIRWRGALVCWRRVLGATVGMEGQPSVWTPWPRSWRVFKSKADRPAGALIPGGGWSVDREWMACAPRWREAWKTCCCSAPLGRPRFRSTRRPHLCDRVSTTSALTNVSNVNLAWMPSCVKIC